MNRDNLKVSSPPCIQRCLEDGGLDPNEVDYINAHGRSTPQGDIAIDAAKWYVTLALQNAPQSGHGARPLNH
jgi:acyl transferase domain-containing protein